MLVSAVLLIVCLSASGCEWDQAMPLSPGDGALVAGQQGRALTSATVVYGDDFESTTALVSSGRWTYLDSRTNTLTSHSDAAHRGGAGLRLVDSTQAAGSGVEVTLQRMVPPHPNNYLRYWMRMTTVVNADGSLIHSQMVGDHDLSLFDLNTLVASDTFFVEGALGAGSFVQDGPAPGAISGNGWHLVELELEGVGTASGIRRFRLDGELQTEGTGLDFRNVQVTSFEVAEPYSNDRRFTGTVDYDDFRWSNVPPASRLVLSSSESPKVGDCTALSLSLVSSAGGLAPAPYDLAVELAAAGVAGAFFEDAACTRATHQLTLASDLSSGMVHFRPTASGLASLSASHTDFLATALQLTVLPNLASESAPEQGAQATASSFQLDEGDGAPLRAYGPTVTARVYLEDSAGKPVVLGPEDSLELSGEAPLKLGKTRVFDAATGSYAQAVSLSSCTQSAKLRLSAHFNGMPVGQPLSVTPVCGPPEAGAALRVESPSMDAAVEQVVPGMPLVLRVSVSDARTSKTPLLLAFELDGLLLKATASERVAVPAGGTNPQELRLDAWATRSKDGTARARVWLETADGAAVSAVAEHALDVSPLRVDYGCSGAPSPTAPFVSCLLLGIGALLRRRAHRSSGGRLDR